MLGNAYLHPPNLRINTRHSQLYIMLVQNLEKNFHNPVMFKKFVADKVSIDKHRPPLTPEAEEVGYDIVAQFGYYDIDID